MARWGKTITGMLVMFVFAAAMAWLVVEGLDYL